MITSQGSELYFTDGTTLYNAGCVLSVTPLGDPISAVDQTPLGADCKTNLPGMITPGAFTISTHYSDAAAIDALLAAKEAGTVLKWCLLLSETATAPTLVAGEIVPPSTRTAGKFSGWLIDTPLSVATNQLVKLSASVSRTDKVVWSRP